MINLTTKEYHLIRCLINGQTLYKFSHVDVGNKKGITTNIEGAYIYVLDVPLSKPMLISDMDSRSEIRDVLGNSIPFKDLVSKLLIFNSNLPEINKEANTFTLDKEYAEELRIQINYYVGDLD